MGAIARRQAQAKARLDCIRGRLSNAEKYLGPQQSIACVYATGSYGRLEASAFSDLDLFIAGQPLDSGSPRELSRLNEICLKAQLVHATREEGLPDFDGDGAYLRHYTVGELLRSLGHAEDDAQNTFTARLLLLLESKPIIGEDFYNQAMEAVIASYWRDYEDHQNDFAPVFLVNDILRLWRTFTVGYEAKTKAKPDGENAKRREKNYKLRHSRVLTCFSTIIYLVHLEAQNGTAHPHDMIGAAKMTPLERISFVREQCHISGVRDGIEAMESAYEDFLTTTEAKSSELREKFRERKYHLMRKNEASSFGDAVFETLTAFGNDNRLVRHLIV